MSRQRDYQLRHLEQGICQNCPVPVWPGTTLCFVCLVKQRTSNRLRYQARTATRVHLGPILGVQLKRSHLDADSGRP